MAGGQGSQGLYADPVLYDILYTPGTAGEVDALERVERRFASCRLPARRLWLEPACGTGRYLRVAAGRGRRCLGFDLDEGQLAYARGRRLRGRGPRPRYFQADMTDFMAAGGLEPGSVDFAFNPVNSLRHLPDDGALLAHFGQMARALKPGALYVVGISLTDYDWLMPEEDLWEGRRGACQVSQLVNYLPPEPGTHLDRVERVLSLALHLLAVALVALAARAANARRVPAWLGAGLLGLHPGASEAVAWISARHDLVASLLLLGGWTALLRRRDVLAGVLLGLAPFAKEPYLLASLTALVWMWGARRFSLATLALSLAGVALYLGVRVAMEQPAAPGPDPQPAIPRFQDGGRVRLREAARRAEPGESLRRGRGPVQVAVPRPDPDRADPVDEHRHDAGLVHARCDRLGGLDETCRAGVEAPHATAPGPEPVGPVGSLDDRRDQRCR